MTNFVESLEAAAAKPMEPVLHVCVIGAARAYGLKEEDRWPDYVRVCRLLGRLPLPYGEYMARSPMAEMCSRVARELPDGELDAARGFLEAFPGILGKDVGSGVTSEQAEDAYMAWAASRGGEPRPWRRVRRDLGRIACIRSGVANRGGRTVRLLVHDPFCRPAVWFPEFEQMPVPEP